MDWISVEDSKILYILYLTFLWPYLRPQALPSPSFFHPLCLEASFQSPFSLPARSSNGFLCPLLLKPGTLSRSRCANCLSCLWLQLHFWSWSFEELQPSSIDLITHFLHSKLDCWSVHGWLRCVGDGGQESCRVAVTPHWMFIWRKEGEMALRQESFYLCTWDLPRLLFCLDQVLSSALAHVNFEAAAKSKGPTLY